MSAALLVAIDASGEDGHVQAEIARARAEGLVVAVCAPEGSGTARRASELGCDVVEGNVAAHAALYAERLVTDDDTRGLVAGLRG